LKTPSTSADMSEKKKTTVTAEEIGEFLKQTGFVFEMRMNELFLKLGYACEINSSFRDLEGDTEREIDLVASKLCNKDINLHFVIECKQSLAATVQRRRVRALRRRKLPRPIARRKPRRNQLPRNRKRKSQPRRSEHAPVSKMSLQPV
jgi:hypothetical protein